MTSLLFLTSVYVVLFRWKEVTYEDNKVDINWFAIVTVVICMISSIILFLFTRKNLTGSRHYKTSELDPIVNNFTSNADKANIKLLAGDINFFGNSPQEMEGNSQYKCLKEQTFREINILCIKPNNNGEKIRYGKILNDLPQVELRFYNPPQADLFIRGRLKTLNNVTHLLIYNRIQSGVYEALEIDTANSKGALYNLLWGLIWDIAKKPEQEQIDEYKRLYRN